MSLCSKNGLYAIVKVLGSSFLDDNVKQIEVIRWFLIYYRYIIKRAYE